MNPIEVTVEDGIATVRINRPERKNALSVAATNGLTDAWEKIEADDNIRVAILTSADCGVFSAGLDLKEATQIARDEGVDILSKMRDPFHETMRSCKKPIIAAMTGSLMAGGMIFVSDSRAPRSALPKSRSAADLPGHHRPCRCCRNPC